VTNILLVIIIVLLLAVLVTQAYIIAEWSRPVIRPRPAPTRRSPLYERFHSPEALDTEHVFCFVV
jgi:hypothetical protein